MKSNESNYKLDIFWNVPINVPINVPLNLMIRSQRDYIGTAMINPLLYKTKNNKY